MPRLATVLRDEVQRATRQEFLKCAARMKALVQSHDQAIAGLTAKLRQVERELAQLQQKKKATKKQEVAAEFAWDHKFTPEGLRFYRRSLKLSADQFSTLLGVSAQSIYSWEQGRVQPRMRQVAAIGALRSLSAQAIAQRLKR